MLDGAAECLNNMAGRHNYMTQKASQIIKSGESETVEFKASFDKEAIESLVAFANTRGGTVFIGVTDDGKISGTETGKETIQNWINQVKQCSAQAIVPDAEVVTIKDRNIVTLSVPEAPIKPVACKGRYYKRVRNANHQMSVTEVVHLHLRAFNTSWDFHIDERHSEADISLDKVQDFIERANRNREVPILDDPLTVLQKFELLRDGKITYACFLLFLSGETSLSTIELGRFQTPTLIKDGMRLKTDLFTEVDGVMQFIQKHINKAYIITGRPQREERWDYPLDAIREIVINAIIHRDYRSTQDSVVKVFDDKIEIFNPGGLPSGITIEKLLKGKYISDARNKKVAEVFKAAGLIEKYGSGIKRILNAFKEYGLPPPDFEEMSGGFMVTVYKKTAPVTEQVTEQVARLVALFPETASSTGELMNLLALMHRPSFLYTYLQPALDSGYIERTIPDKPQSRLQRYRLTQKGKEFLVRLKK